MVPVLPPPMSLKVQIGAVGTVAKSRDIDLLDGVLDERLDLVKVRYSVPPWVRV